MASLIIESGPLRGTTVSLAHGPNLLGRSSECGVRFEDPTVSGVHCELQVTEFGVQVKDLGSSNGTAINGKLVREAELRDGQLLSLGSLALRAVIPPVQVAIPELSPPEPTGPAVTVEGLPACHTHRSTPATHVCSHCSRTFCSACVRPIRILGGKTRLMCPACSNLCHPLAGNEDEAGRSLGGRIARAFRTAFDFRRPPRRRR